MSGVAEYVRRCALADVTRMDAQTRIRVALELGDADLTRYCEVHGLNREEGRRRLMRQRQIGRRPSAAASR